MKKILYPLLLIIISTLLSCENKPGIYHSVSGSWRCEEYNPIDGQRVYMSDIDRSKGDTTLYLISNFHNLDINEFVYAQLKDSILSISQQTLSDLIVKSGTGIISKDYQSIEFNYEVFDGQNNIKSHAIFSRPE
jgi:hypothetical protein